MSDKPRKKWRWLMWLLLALVVAYALGLAALVFFQRDVLYLPEKVYTPPSIAGAPAALREVTVKTQDGLELTGWYAAATTQKRTIVFFHGNADSLRRVYPIAAPYMAAGYGFLIAEYRGYSGNPGMPTEVGLYDDARAFINALEGSDVKEGDIVLYGHSLGTGVAMQMAMEYKAAGLILEAPYMSIAKMAQFRFPIFPAEMLTQDRFESFKKIPTLHMPLFVAHGGWDLIVPISQGRALYDLAPEPKVFFYVAKGGHMDLSHFGFAEAVMKWIEKLP